MFKYALKMVYVTVVYTLTYILKYFNSIFELTLKVWPPFPRTLLETLRAHKTPSK
jgi:hypothetical protein